MDLELARRAPPGSPAPASRSTAARAGRS